MVSPEAVMGRISHGFASGFKRPGEATSAIQTPVDTQGPAVPAEQPVSPELLIIRAHAVTAARKTGRIQQLEWRSAFNSPRLTTFEQRLGAKAEALGGFNSAVGKRITMVKAEVVDMRAKGFIA